MKTTIDIPADLTPEEAKAAREWATDYLESAAGSERVRAAARVVIGTVPEPRPTTTAKENPERPDQTLDDQIRPIVAAMRAAMRRDESVYPEARFLADMSGYIRDLEALLPKRPTLADMPPEERNACQRMQADLEGHDSRVVIVNTRWLNDTARVMWPDFSIGAVPQGSVTPRPDLPRLEWPGDQKAAPGEAPESEEEFMANIEKALDDHYGPLPTPALPEGWRLADHQRNGRVIATNPTPDSDGYVYVVLPDVDKAMGYDWDACLPSTLTYLDQEADQ